MQAVEFQAKIKNGTIEIPSQYKDKLKLDDQGFNEKLTLNRQTRYDRVPKD